MHIFDQFCSQDIERKQTYDKRNDTDGRNDGQPKSSIGPLFQSELYNETFVHMRSMTKLSPRPSYIESDIILS